MSDTNRRNWLHAGLKVLDKQGFSELKIDTLCRRLQVTKGSFYHWFDSKKDFDQALLEHWKEVFTDDFISQSETGQSSKEKLQILIRQCIDGMQKNSKLEIQINMWSKSNRKVEKFVGKVYEKRFNYLVALLEDIYPEKQEAKRHALLLYCLFIGVDLFFRQISPGDAELMFREYLGE